MQGTPSPVVGNATEVMSLTNYDTVLMSPQEFYEDMQKTPILVISMIAPDYKKINLSRSSYDIREKAILDYSFMAPLKDKGHRSGGSSQVRAAKGVSILLGLGWVLWLASNV